MNRKLWSNDEKVAIVLEILRGNESAAVICTRYGVSATQAYRLLDWFLEGETQGFHRQANQERLPSAARGEPTTEGTGRTTSINHRSQKKLAGILRR